jgi:hypothetical protein
MNNTALGYLTLSANTTGQSNTAVGFLALTKNTTGQFNTALGAYTMDQNTTGQLNTALGHFALRQNTIGSSNTAVGEQTLYVNTSGSGNTALGYMALRESQISNSNTAVGSDALRQNLTGGGNTAVGVETLIQNQTGSNNTAVGFKAGPSVGSTGLTNTTAIGYQSQVSCSNCLVLGDTNVNVGIGTATPDAKLEVAGQIKITGGSPGAGKVLTSDAAGLASWQTPSGGGGGVGSSVVEIYCEDLNATTRASCSTNCPAGYRVMSCGGYGCSHSNEIRNYGSWPSDSDTCRCYTWGPTGVTVSIMCWGLCIPL